MAGLMLGEPSQPGSTQTLAELLTGRLGTMSWFTTRLGRLLTNRRDFAVEETGTGSSKYMIDGITRSLHSRMQISFPNEESPRFVVRRAFNYLNPIASTVGQYIYRVIRCTDEQGGWAGGCREGEILYTITKDRFGRGALWGQDEYRVYTGTGGCWRHGSGVLSCSSELQMMYSLSAGLSSGTHDTTFYSGNIRAIDGDHLTGRLHDGTELDTSGLFGMQVATVSKASGSPRALNWPIAVADGASDVAAGAAVGGAYSIYLQLADLLTNAQYAMLAEHFMGQASDATETIANVIDATQPQLDILESTGHFTLGAIRASSRASNFAIQLAWAYHIAKSLVWADSYNVVFDGNGGSTDDLLVNVVAAVQDLTREALAISAAR